MWQVQSEVTDRRDADDRRGAVHMLYRETFIWPRTNIFSRVSSESTLDERYLY